MTKLESAVALFNHLKSYLADDADCLQTAIDYLELTAEEAAELDRLVMDW